MKNTPSKLEFESQVEISQKMRSILVDWMVSVTEKFDFRDETFFLSLNLLDRYISLNTVRKNALQLLGVTCLFISAKYEEIYPPEMGDFLKLCAGIYTPKQLIEQEGLVLNLLEFNLVATLPLHLLNIYLQQRTHIF